MGIQVWNQEFHLFNANISYIFSLATGKYPVHLYWGKRIRSINDHLVERLTGFHDGVFSLNEFSLTNLPLEFSNYGFGDLREGSVHLIRADGTHTFHFVFQKYEILAEKPKLSGLPSSRGEASETLILTFQDELSQTAIQLLYTVYEDCDVIARSMRIVNHSNDNIVVEKAMSASVDFENADYDLVTLSGSWAREREIMRRPLVMGDQGTSTVCGASSLQTSPFMAIMEHDADENHGNVYGFSLCYSGSFSASVQLDPNRMGRAMIGIQPFNFHWVLNPSETFQTPEAYLCFSENGIGQMSRSYHTFIHRHITSGPYCNSARPILINNWEATYFNFNNEKLLALAEKAKSVGIDLFVLDDGWFGHRDSDNSSLGDWFDDTGKLPDGIAGLGEKLHTMGMKFGLWFEPEMVSPDSELYRQHPDWCIHCGNYERIERRNQLVLDLSRQDVRDYIVESVSAAMKRGNVDYVKWDMNRNISPWGSECLDSKHQQEQSHRYILGLYEILDRIVSAFPNVLFESCSSGGGRFDMGMLCYMPQTWCSDDTDAYMRCRIQYSTSYVFPPSSMGAHISAVPNHQCGRITPLATRAAVAMGGTFGYELNLLQLSSEELDSIRKINQKYRLWQELLYYGDFYRLLSPYQGWETAWMSVSSDKKRAILTHVTEKSQPNEKNRLLKLRGLCSELDYRELESGMVYGGDELMLYGIAIPRPNNDYAAVQMYFEAVEKE